ncbi:MAG TPA: signal peptide peptidase SppA [Opitutaceae bacterium]|nr:signal peptide peptidase SppA [Opitutaceae bacterium]
MKTFFASLLGSIAGLFIFVFGLAVVAVGFVGVMASMGSKPVVVEKGSYLVFDLNADISDAPPQPNPFEIFTAMENADQPKALQLRAVTRALHAAAKDDRLLGVLVTGHMVPNNYGSSLAALREVREALAAVRRSGKDVIAYLENSGTREIYLGSVASDIVMNPYGQVSLPGLASEPMFLVGALDKVGVGVQVARVGKYKSAVEPLLRKDLSPESREQLQKLLDDLWGAVSGEIASSREITPAALQALVDNEGYIRPGPAVASKLVDRVGYRDELISELKLKTGRTGKTGSFRQISLVDYSRVARDPEADGAVEAKSTAGLKKSGQLAVVYAEGAIVDGEGTHGEVGGSRFARELRQLRQDPQISAIVIRVNSPGGSATASEHILREVRLAREAKPVVISMGGYAASGGYWISTFGERIFAENATITGSIGVFSVLIDVQKLAANLGVTFDVVKTGKFADMETISRPKTAEELAIFQRDADWIYSEFLNRVAEARKLSPARVREIAQGRVWSGADALKVGLVDEIGGLDSAVAYAAQRAGLEPGYVVREFPRAKAFAETLAELLEGMQTKAVKNDLIGRITQRLRAQASTLAQFNDPQHLYARLPLEIVVQ